jgi:hypothetical protein
MNSIRRKVYLFRNAIYGLAVYAELVPTLDDQPNPPVTRSSPKRKTRTSSNLNDLAVLAQLLQPEQSGGNLILSIIILISIFNLE